MFNNISIPFNYEIHKEYSAFHQHNVKNHDQLLNELDLCFKNCYGLSEKNILKCDQKEIAKEIDDLYSSSFIQKFRKRMISVPPLYIKNLCLSFINNLPKFTEDINLDYTDVLFEKNVLEFPEKSSLIASKIPLSDHNFFINNPQKISIWHDNVIKEIVSNGLIDVVINLDSFVKLILCYLNELNEDYYLPFLKISVGEDKRNCIVFDKVLNTSINADGERLKYLKYCVIRQYYKSYSTSSQSRVRIIKSKDGIKTVKSDNIVKEFISNVGQTTERPNLKLNDSETEIYPLDSSENDANIECNVTTASLKDEAGRYSYGLWQLADLRLLFRFKNYVEKVDGCIGKRLGCVYTRFQMKNKLDQTDCEGAWKSLIGSKLNLHSNIIKIIIDAENKTIDHVTSETFEEFICKNSIIMERYTEVMGVLRNLLEEISLSKQLEPDYYLLHLTSGSLNVLKSTNDKNVKDIDLRNITRF